MLQAGRRGGKNESQLVALLTEEKIRRGGRGGGNARSDFTY